LKAIKNFILEWDDDMSESEKAVRLVTIVKYACDHKHQLKKCFNKFWAAVHEKAIEIDTFLTTADDSEDIKYIRCTMKYIKCNL